MPPKKKEEEPRKILLGRPGNNVKIGIVGVPNVGKSSLFNALSKLNVAAENFPFCTIDPNIAMVPVPDQRFNWLCRQYKPKSEVPPTVTITDIAGLVRGASEGAGLGNAFLSHIHATDGIYMMLRAFEDADIVHVEGDVNPVRDIEIIIDELRIKDIETVTKALEKDRRLIERGAAPREMKADFGNAEKALEWLESGKLIRFGNWGLQEVETLNRLQLLTSKEIVYLINLSKKDYLRKKNKWLPKINEVVEMWGGGAIIPFSVEFEQDWMDADIGGTLDNYKAENPTHKSMMPRILKSGYSAMQLIHYFTAGEDEVKAWTIKDGWLAPQAAGVIHTDFERGFICADVMSYGDLKELGGEEAVKKAGKLRQQGKKYQVLDGVSYNELLDMDCYTYTIRPEEIIHTKRALDVIHFKFNV